MAGSGNTSAFATDYGNRSTDECPWRDDYRARHADLIQQWKTNGIFSDGDLDDVNCYWLQFEPAPLLNHLILAFVIFVVSVIGCFSNALVVYILSTSRHLRTPANIIVMNLAISDFIMLIKMPVFVYNSLVQGPALGYRGCEIYGFLSGMTGCTSIMSLSAVALDRYLVISRPFQVDKKPTRVWAYIIVVSIWIYSTVFSSLPLFGIGKYVPEGYLTSCSFDYLSTDWNTRVFILSFFVAAWVIPLSIIVSCYTAIVRYVSRASREFPGQHLQRRRKQPDHEPLRDDTANKKRSWNSIIQVEVSIAKTTIGLVTLWILSWTPYAIVALLGISGNQHRLTPGMTMIPALFAKTSACINPFIYSLSHPKMKKEIKRRYRCWTKGTDSSQRTVNHAASERNSQIVSMVDVVGSKAHHATVTVRFKSRITVKSVLRSPPLNTVTVLPSAHQLSGLVNGHHFQQCHRPSPKHKLCHAEESHPFAICNSIPTSATTGQLVVTDPRAGMRRDQSDSDCSPVFESKLLDSNKQIDYAADYVDVIVEGGNWSIPYADDSV